MATLYQLTEDYAAALAQLEAAESDEEANAILEILDCLDVDMAAKGEAYAKAMKNCLADAEMYKAEAKRLAERQKAAERAADRLKQRMLDTMTALGAESLKTGIGTWRVQLNPWKCDVENIADVPEQYRVPVEVPYTIDKAACKADFIETGEIIPGVRVYREAGVRFR